MSIFASLYMDEDMSALVATLLRSRGLDVTTVPEQSTLIIVVPQKTAYEVVQRVGVLVNTLTVDSINNQLLYA